MDARLLENVKYFREKAQLTPEELSIRIGKDKDYIELFEKDKMNSYPPMSIIKNIANQLNIEVKELFKYDR